MTAPQADFAGALDEMPALFDEPFGDSAAWSNYLIAQFARREVTVALSGEGGDEIFCGYPRYWSRIGARSNFLQSIAGAIPAAAVALRLLDAAPRATSACRRMPRRLGGMTAQQIDSLLADRVAGAGLRLSVVLPAVLARGFEAARRNCAGSI